MMLAMTAKITDICPADRGTDTVVTLDLVAVLHGEAVVVLVHHVLQPVQPAVAPKIVTLLQFCTICKCFS